VWELPSSISKCFLLFQPAFTRLSNFTGLRFKMDRLCSRKTPLSSLVHVKPLIQVAVAHEYEHLLPRFGCFFTNPIAANRFRVFGSDDESNSTDQSPQSVNPPRGCATSQTMSPMQPIGPPNPPIHQSARRLQTGVGERGYLIHPQAPRLRG
jgi:hypothetical protein